ncbi:hypothetical protein GGU10DRAFT_386032 [Lentinula aff. detonsa]|uniref:Uncharacterized protein n=1 Tax=Lentinula aff. detonsa TaxID=2804958 RepID=A0AA38KQZ5_9AGAR|nr:hypothetical protein GGU10DRAFT_386032 [Lentinula aff. detonsa]
MSIPLQAKYYLLDAGVAVQFNSYAYLSARHDDGEIVHEPEVELPDTDVGGFWQLTTCIHIPQWPQSARLLSESRLSARLAESGDLRCGHLIDGKCLEALRYPEGALDARKGKGKSLLDPADATDRVPHIIMVLLTSSNKSSSSNSHDDATANSTALPPRFSLGASIADSGLLSRICSAEVGMIHRK